MPTFGKVRIRIEGVMPERALLKLRRAEIQLFSIQKRDKTTLDCTAWQKDLVKIFAIYPKVCYNIDKHSTYTVRVLGERGALKYVRKAKCRAGFLLGALCFCIGSLYLDTLVLGVEFVGTSVYARETLEVLEKSGIRAFAPYKRGEEDGVCSKLLTLRGVEFCSVQKSGLYVRVEMRMGEEMPMPVRAGAYTSGHTGTLLAVTALSGTPVRAVGDHVQKGEILIEDCLVTPSGERIRADVVGRAVIDCVYEAIIEAEDETQAFASAYLSAGLGENDTLTERTVTAIGNGFAVRMRYTAVESFNL